MSNIANAAAVAVANAAARIAEDKTLQACHKRTIIRIECQKAGVTLDDFIAAATAAAANIRATLV